MNEVVLAHLSRPLEAFRSAVASAVEQLRGQLDDAALQAEAQTGEGDEGAADLGVFAAGRIDATRFAAVAARESVALEPAVMDRIRKAYETLLSLMDRGSGLFEVTVERGESLEHAVLRAFSDIGRAFGAARVAELARSGLYKEAEHGAWLDAYGFEAWNARERTLAPPLVVYVDGVDLQAEGLAPFLDGSLKIVVVVRDTRVAPAPLVRLVTPGVYVLQTRSEADLADFAAWDGPGIAALVPEGAATWRHDPDAGPNTWDRIRTDHLPDASPQETLGALSAFQQNEPLRQLRALATKPVAAVAGTGVEAVLEAPADPVDKLAAWLMQQADLTGL